MNWINTVRNYLATLLATERVPLPESGRSSIDKAGLNSSLAHFSTHYDGISNAIDFDMLKTLKQLWIFHPEFSQHISNIVSLANTGHQITLNASTESQATRALQRLNETSAQIWKRGAGVDGLINAELTQLAWSGAISSEDVVNIEGKRIEKVVPVPVEDIRFKYDKEIDEWKPYQYVGFADGAKNGLIELHPETYRYYAIETIENSPYAKPPATAAVQAITEMQNEVIENIKYIVNKFSILGLLTVMVRRLVKSPNETEQEYNGRSTKYLKEVTNSLSGNFNKGLVAAFDNMKFSGENVTANGSGFYEVYRVIAETFMSGLKQQPAFFGRTDSTTETYADVVYQLLLANADNFQRVVKRRRERTYRLDLRLGGLQVEGVSLKFNKSFSRNRLSDAQAEQTETQTALEKARSGIISADQAAQELGYDSAYDSNILEENISLARELKNLRAENLTVNSFAFRFNKKTQKYTFVPTQTNIVGEESLIEAENLTENIVPFSQKKKSAQQILN